MLPNDPLKKALNKLKKSEEDVSLDNQKKKFLGKIRRKNFIIEYFPLIIMILLVIIVAHLCSGIGQ